MHHQVMYSELVNQKIISEVLSSTKEQKKLCISTVFTFYEQPLTRYEIYHGDKVVFSTAYFKGGLAVYNGITCSPQAVQIALNS